LNFSFLTPDWKWAPNRLGEPISKERRGTAPSLEADCKKYFYPSHSNG
jgi:hypothetical protein